MTKRAFDVAVCLLLAVPLLPVAAVVAVTIKLSGRGPVLYRGRRAGRGGVPFEVLKFRTMVVDAERLGGSSSGKHDPRITPVGRFLRRWKLDELLQLWNVLRGDMSLVGPRPEVERFAALYTGEDAAVLDLRPGITDWASIWNADEGAALAGADDPDAAYLEWIRPTKVALQLRYARSASVLTDLRILAWTLRRIAGDRRLPAELRDVEPPGIGHRSG